MTTSPRAWSLDKNDAWMYGIVCGWSTGEVLRLRLLRISWEKTNRVIKETK